MADSNKEPDLRDPEKEYHINWGGTRARRSRPALGHQTFRWDWPFVLESNMICERPVIYRDRDIYNVPNTLAYPDHAETLDVVALAKALRIFSEPGDQYAQIWDAPYTGDLSKELQDLHRAFLTLNNAIIAYGRRYIWRKWGKAYCPFGAEDFGAINGVWFPWDFEGWTPNDGDDVIIPGYAIAQGTIQVLSTDNKSVAEFELGGEKFKIQNYREGEYGNRTLLEEVDSWMNTIQRLSTEGSKIRTILDAPYEEYKTWDETYTDESEDGFRRDYTFTEHKVKGEPLYIQKFKRLLGILNGAKVSYLQRQGIEDHRYEINLVPFGLLSISQEDGPEI